jgi:hypothetical protein
VIDLRGTAAPIALFALLSQTPLEHQRGSVQRIEITQREGGRVKNGQEVDHAEHAQEQLTQSCRKTSAPAL